MYYFSPTFETHIVLSSGHLFFTRTLEYKMFTKDTRVYKRYTVPQRYLIE